MSIKSILKIDSLAKPNIGKLKKEKNVKGLLKATVNKDQETRLSAIKAMIEMKNDIRIKTLLPYLKNKKLGRFVAYIISQYRDESVIEPINNMLKTETEPKTICYLIECIARIGGLHAANIIIEYLKDDNFKVQSAAIEALGNVGEDCAIDPLYDLFINKYNGKNRNAAIAIGKIGSDKSIDYFIKKLHGYAGIENAERWFNSMNDLSGFGEIYSKYLYKYLSHENSGIRSGVATALNKMSAAPTNIIDKIYYYFSLGNLTVLEELYINNKECVNSTFITLLRDSDYAVRQKAAQYLEKLGWKYNNDTEKIYYLMAKDRWKEASLNLDLKFAKDILSNLLSNPFLEDIELNECFGEYTPIIMGYATIDRQVDGGGADYGKIDFDLSKSNNALEQLCLIKSKISSNLLHEIIFHRKNVYGEVSWRGPFSTYKEISFDAQRKIAEDELKNRGDPQYEPNEYLESDSWSIHL